MRDDTSSNNALTTIRITRRAIGRWRREKAAPRGICARADVPTVLGTRAGRASGVPRQYAQGSEKGTRNCTELATQPDAVSPITRPVAICPYMGPRLLECESRRCDARLPRVILNFPSESFPTVTVVRAAHLALPLLSELARVRKKTGISALGRIVSSRLLLPEGPPCGSQRLQRPQCRPPRRAVKSGRCLEARASRLTTSTLCTLLSTRAVGHVASQGPVFTASTEIESRGGGDLIVMAARVV